jgi:hypothetical protein
MQQDDRWITARVIAYRLAGEEGWRLEETDLTLEQAGQAITQIPSSRPPI